MIFFSENTSFHLFAILVNSNPNFNRQKRNLAIFVDFRRRIAIAERGSPKSFTRVRIPPSYVIAPRESQKIDVNRFPRFGKTSRKNSTNEMGDWKTKEWISLPSQCVSFSESSFGRR